MYELSWYFLDVFAIGFFSMSIKIMSIKTATSTNVESAFQQYMHSADKQKQTVIKWID